MIPVTFYRSEAQEGIHAPRLVLAHGAGAPADSSFMDRLASALSVEGVTVLRFEFPYMEKRRQDGRKRPPDRLPVLLECFREAIDAVVTADGEGGRIFIGGKSMGGRMASHIIAQAALCPEICAAVCFGYPFHPPGRPDRWRTDHFKDLQRPLKIIQGARDPFGRKHEVEDQGVGTMESVSLSWLEGADHDYRPLVRQQETHDEMIRQASGLAAGFMHRCK